MLSNGDKIGPYTIRETAGQGGMATVYKAWHEGLHRFEALKVPRGAGGDADSAYIQRLLTEARVAAGLQHPNIVAIHSVSEPLAPVPYFAMNWVEGRDLAKTLAEKRSFSLQETIQILEPIADALDYAHSKGVVHRDIKPANILIEEVGGVLVPRVVDFGISRAAEDEDGATKLTKSGMIVGTPEYMSPEQAGSGEVVDYRTDIYSLAVLAYEMLCGGPPFTAGSGVSRLSILISHVRDTAPLFAKCPNFPVAAGQVLLSALAKAPQERPQSCREFLAQLKAGSGAGFSIAAPIGNSVTSSGELTPFDESRFEVADAATLCERPPSSAVPTTPALQKGASPTILPGGASSANFNETRSDSLYSLRARLEAAQTPVSVPVAAQTSSLAAVAISSAELTRREAEIVDSDVGKIQIPIAGAEKELVVKATRLPFSSSAATRKPPVSIGVLWVGCAAIVVASTLTFAIWGRNSTPIATAEPLAKAEPAPRASGELPVAAKAVVAGSQSGLRTIQLKRTRAVDFSTVTRRSSTREAGSRVVEQQGKPGAREIVFRVIYRGQKEVARQVQSQRLILDPVPQIVVIGDRKPQFPVEVSASRQVRNPRFFRRRESNSPRELTVRKAPEVARPRVREARKVVESRPVARAAQKARVSTVRQAAPVRARRFVREAPLPP